MAIDDAQRTDYSPRMRPGRKAGRASASGSYRAGARLVTWWLHRYTHGVDPRFVETRQSEVEFELWEHGIAADEHRWSGVRAAGGLLTHTIAGAPHDLWWRRLALAGPWYPAVPSVRLLSPRHRGRFWVPLQQGHIFDQTNGMIAAEQAIPYDPGPGAFGTTGRAFGMPSGS
jgi:hypothetical protein